MKKVPVALLILGLAAAPGWAQSKLDKAVKKAYEKLEDGKPDEAVKELTKATKDGGAPAWLAVAELREGNFAAPVAVHHPDAEAVARTVAAHPQGHGRGHLLPIG